jgi:hypothetical protein
LFLNEQAFRQNKIDIRQNKQSFRKTEQAFCQSKIDTCQNKQSSRQTKQGNYQNKTTYYQNANHRKLTKMNLTKTEPHTKSSYNSGFTIFGF